LFQVKEVTAVDIEDAASSPADPETNVSSPPSASGILNNATQIP
jgi:hypothetical protein